uniref:Neur_chan_LBD domain-containing protein n=1 Tax=Haemonchus contortus TaxID=6289 RepID=A0A7I4Y9Q9_HAECO
MFLAPRFIRMFSNLLFLGSLVQSIRLTPARKLLNELLPDTYETAVRPNSNETTTIVTITPNKIILLSMDQQQESIVFSEEILVSWTDPQLVWNRNKTTYSREWIKIPETSVWVPDIIYTEATERHEMVPVEGRMADLRYDGTVRVSNPTIVTYPCPLHIDSFPYDVQKCNLTIGSWNYEADDVLVQPASDRIEPELNQFEGNSEWELYTIRAFPEIQFDADQNQSFSVVIYQVQLKRKPVYYVLVIQIPTFIMTTLTIFGIFTPFSNTPERREKVTLVLNMFVSISMMLNLVAEMMPKASRLPLLGNYILSEIFVCAGALLVSIVTLVLHQRFHTRCARPPKWVLRVLLCQSRATDVYPLHNLPPSFTTAEQDTTSGLFDKRDFLEAVEQATAALRTKLNRLRYEDGVRLTWIRVFDRIDLICLIIFQLANIVCSILFMR